MSVYEPASPATPVEDVNRGTVVALAAIPVGVIVWTVVWTLGAILSIITYGVAFLAMFLYKLGSGGTISRAGAIRVTIVTIVTVVLSIITGLISDVAVGIGRVTGDGPIAALSNPNFGEVFSSYVTSGDAGLLFSLGIALLFGVLGCFGVLRTAFRATAPVAAGGFDPAAPWPTLPATPPATDRQAPLTDPTDPAAPRA